MKLAIVGSRTFTNYKLLENVVSRVQNVEYIISGGANGTDTLAEVYAKKYNYSIKIIRADWNKYGKKAGYLRNKLIIEECDGCLAFWDGKSKGTLININLCKELNKKCVIIDIIKRK